MSRGARKYPIPDFLERCGIDQNHYGRWLDKVTIAITRRDQKRLKQPLSKACFRCAIHKAVCEGGDRDYYTGEKLNWKLLQHFNGIAVPERKHHEVPSVDHDQVHPTKPIFRICSLRTNKCKSDYSIEEVLAFCEAFIAKQKKHNS